MRWGRGHVRVLVVWPWRSNIIVVGPQHRVQRRWGREVVVALVVVVVVPAPMVVVMMVVVVGLAASVEGVLS